MDNKYIIAAVVVILLALAVVFLSGHAGSGAGASTQRNNSIASNFTPFINATEFNDTNLLTNAISLNAP